MWRTQHEKQKWQKLKQLFCFWIFKKSSKTLNFHLSWRTIMDNKECKVYKITFPRTQCFLLFWICLLYGMFLLNLPEKHCRKIFFPASVKFGKLTISYCQMVLHCYSLILRFMFVILFSLKSEKYKEKTKDLGAPEMLHVLIEQTL